MAYMHGVRIQENPTSVPTPAKNETGVPVILRDCACQFGGGS